MCVFFIEIFDGEFEGVGDESFGFFLEVLSVLFEEVHI